MCACVIHYYPMRMCSKGLSNRVDVCLSVRGPKDIETAEMRGYLLRKGYYNNV